MYTQTFVETTHNIQVAVRPVYMEEDSDPSAGRHVFAYFITIRNLGSEAVQLLKRHWLISDSAGEEFNVDGDGVVGRQPVLECGEEYEYNSFCVLKSYIGSMQGYYVMEKQTLEGESVKVRIPEFHLRSHLLN